MKVLLTIDVEAHRTIDEITGSTSDSLGDILQAFDTWGARATFFVDVCEVATWGREFLQSVCDKIVRAGHDVQLHVHPHHYTKDNSRWLLSEYTRSEQVSIFDYAFAQFEDLLGRAPVAFRAGGFGLNDDTIDILIGRGVRVDASYMYRRKGCSIDVEHVGFPSKFRGLCEVPMTPAIMLGTKSHPLRCTSIDFNWLPLFVIKRILRRCKSEGMPLAVLLMHSSSMCVRIGRSVEYRRSHFRKLQKLLAFLREEGLEQATIAELEVDRMIQPAPKAGAGVYWESNPLVQYSTLLFQSFKGAGIKPRFALFFWANVCGGFVVLAVLCMALLGLLKL